MPPYITNPHFSNALLFKRLINSHNIQPEVDPEPAQTVPETENENNTKSIASTIAGTLSSTLATSTTPAAPTVTTEGMMVRMEHAGEKMLETVSDKTHIPFWGVFFIFIVIVGIFLIVFYCCLQRWWRKFRGKEGKGFMGGKVDLKSVQLLGQAYKEKVGLDQWFHLFACLILIIG